jgi:hypothetical protein
MARRSRRTKLTLANLIIFLVIVGVYFVYTKLESPAGKATPTPVSTVQRVVVPTVETVTPVAPETVVVLTGGPCHGANGLPDRRCTPGAADERVTQANIQQTICKSGYTKTVRPPVSYTDPLKHKLMARYGYSDSEKNYELDHLIPLEVGGHPSSELNLFPEPYSPKPGAREKDQVENYLHEQVCSGQMTLKAAQDGIRTNWLQYFPVRQGAADLSAIPERQGNSTG